MPRVLAEGSDEQGNWFLSAGVPGDWADLAVASWSTVWNYGPGFEEPLFEVCGVTPDWDRIRYYRLLWDLVD